MPRFQELSDLVVVSFVNGGGVIINEMVMGL